MYASASIFLKCSSARGIQALVAASAAFSADASASSKSQSKGTIIWYKSTIYAPVADIFRTPADTTRLFGKDTVFPVNCFAELVSTKVVKNRSMSITLPLKPFISINCPILNGLVTPIITYPSTHTISSLLTKRIAPANAAMDSANPAIFEAHIAIMITEPIDQRKFFTQTNRALLTSGAVREVDRSKSLVHSRPNPMHNNIVKPVAVVRKPSVLKKFCSSVGSGIG